VSYPALSLPQSRGFQPGCFRLCSGVKLAASSQSAVRQAQNPDLSRIKQRGPILKLMQWCANKIGLRSDMPELNENLKLPILLVAAI